MIKTIEQGLKRLTEIQKELEINQTQKEALHNELLKVKSDIRKLRITKKKLKDGTKGYEILCVCGRKYTTAKNPDAELKDDRPQCRICGVRVERER